MKIRIEKYHEGLKKEWDHCVATGKNTSFLFYRDFMEYHADRFEDHSLTFWMGRDIIALLPANEKNGEIYSHQGLTYGGFVVKPEIKMVEFIEIYFAALKYLSENNFATFYLKLIPRIYATMPSDEIDWLVFISKAALYRRDFTQAIRQPSSIKWQNRRMRAIRQAEKLKPVIKKENSESAIRNYWQKVLEPNLINKHDVTPVHTWQEMHTLAQRFPGNITQFNVYAGAELMAGCTMFINQNVAHAQYIAGTEEGKKNGFLDYLFHYLITQEYVKIPWFDLGICNENDGQDINFGLLDWKEGFGARAVSHDFYRIDTSSYTSLTDYLN